MTVAREWVYARTAARIGCYLLILLALLLFWLHTPGGEIEFVYNAF